MLFLFILNIVLIFQNEPRLIQVEHISLSSHEPENNEASIWP